MSRLLPSFPRNLIRVVYATGDPDFIAYMIVFSPHGGGTFHIYGISDQGRDMVSEPKHIGQQSPPAGFLADQLRDFQIALVDPRKLTNQEGTWTLWTLWEHDGKTIIAYSELAQAGSTGDPPWILAPGTAQPEASLDYFEDLLQSSGARGVSDVFSEYICYPRRYSPSTLEHAADRYTTALLNQPGDRSDALTRQYSSISQRICSIVGAHVSLEYSEDTGAPLYDKLARRLMSEWVRFVAMCNESKSSSEYPLNLIACTSRNMIFGMTRNSIIIPVVQDTASVLRALSTATPEILDEFQLQSEMNVNFTFPLLGVVGPDLLSLARISSDFFALFPSEIALVLETRLLEFVCEPYSVTVRDLCEELEPLHSECIEESDHHLLLAKLDSLSRTGAAMKSFLRVMVTEQVLPGLEDPSADLPTDLAIAILTESLTVAIEARYQLTLQLVILLIYMTSEIPANRFPVEDEDVDDQLVMLNTTLDLDGLLHSALAALHSLHILCWTCAQPVPYDILEKNATETEDTLLHKMNGLQVASDSASATGTMSADLLNALLRSGYNYGTPTLFPSHLTSPCSFTRCLTNLFSHLSLLHNKTMVLVNPQDLQFVQKILHLQLPSATLTIANMYPRNVGLQYLIGVAQLSLGRFDEAQSVLEKAVIGICKSF